MVFENRETCLFSLDNFTVTHRFKFPSDYTVPKKMKTVERSVEPKSIPTTIEIQRSEKPKEFIIKSKVKGREKSVESSSKQGDTISEMDGGFSLKPMII